MKNDGLDEVIAVCAENELRAACGVAASFVEKLIVLGQASDGMRVADFHNALVPILTTEARAVLGILRNAAPTTGRRA